jgi:negative regulator of flagellin synthesis FlgM
LKEAGEMKINDVQQGSNTIQYVNQTNQAEKNTTAQGVKNPEASGDKVELSALSREMQKINDVLEMTPDVRAERVSELKAAIQEGRYNIDSEAVADKMIRETLLDFTK